MKTVVERLTCDIGGEVGYSDAHHPPYFATLEFDLAGVKIELECCDGCNETVVNGLTINELMEKGRRVDKYPNAAIKRKPKSKPVKAEHIGQLLDDPEEYVLASGEGYVCPSYGCIVQPVTFRGLKAHWTRAQNAAAA